jgi:hypothetical protein
MLQCAPFYFQCMISLWAAVGDNTKNFRYPWLSDQKLVMEAASCASLTGSRSRRHKGPVQ